MCAAVCAADQRLFDCCVVPVRAKAGSRRPAGRIGSRPRPVEGPHAASQHQTMTYGPGRTRAIEGPGSRSSLRWRAAPARFRPKRRNAVQPNRETSPQTGATHLQNLTHNLRVTRPKMPAADASWINRAFVYTLDGDGLPAVAGCRPSVCIRPRCTRTWGLPWSWRVWAPAR